ncbi:MAG: hypothetical protein KF709_12585 [Gemmatimonadaceae bacterium]|nr:hypothetical protein [Gemmatimonadaceae bacterium]
MNTHSGPDPRSPETRRALDAIRAVGGDELVEAMSSAFLAFAAAQEEWLARQFLAKNFEAVAEGARALRISALQLGAGDVAAACAAAELAGAGGDAAAVQGALEQLSLALVGVRKALG